MNIADYIIGSALAAQRQRVEAGEPALRDGCSRTQALLDHTSGSRTPVHTETTARRREAVIPREPLTRPLIPRDPRAAAAIAVGMLDS